MVKRRRKKFSDIEADDRKKKEKELFAAWDVDDDTDIKEFTKGALF